MDEKCGECERSIPAGVAHEVATGDCTNEEFEFHTCPDCNEIARALQTEGRDYGFLWGQLEEYGGEDGQGAFEHFNSGCLKRIESAAAKAYLMELGLSVLI